MHKQLPTVDLRRNALRWEESQEWSELMKAKAMAASLSSADKPFSLERGRGLQPGMPWNGPLFTVNH